MLQIAVDFLVYTFARLDPVSRIGQAVNFFVYDSVKILILLFAMIACIGVLRTFLPLEKLQGWIASKGALGNVLASAFGAVTPFCSCSSIPIFLGFLKAGVPLGVALSFLITSPLINEYLAVLMLGFFGWKVTVAYIASGMLMGIVAGIVIGKLRQEKNLVEDMQCAGQPLKQERFGCFLSRVRYGISEAWGVFVKIWLWVIVGVGLGALIHNYVPQSAVNTVVSKTGIFSVPLATLLGVPLYGSCVAIVPIALVLFQKGFPLGTSLAFMMAVAALSLPEAFMLRRAMRLPLIGIFFGVTALGIIITGYAFNFLQVWLV